MAQIGWIDFSPDHRDRVAAVLDMLRPEGVVDELGIGRIRDAFANQMFPGFSTIQTRAKYFFLVPYLLYEYQRLPVAQQRRIQPDKYLEAREFEVMWKLADLYEHKEGTGVIGITKRKPEKIMRRPSAIYWNGLATFGLIRHGGLGVDSFLRSRAEMSDSLTSNSSQGDDSPRDDADADYINTFQLRLPYDQKWLESLTLDLTRSEAKLLADRIRATGKGLLIGELMKDKGRFNVFTRSESFSDFARISASQDLLSHSVAHTVILAHDFSELMFGAHCAYNCILQAKKYASADFADDWTSWIKNFRSRMIDFKGFDPEEVLSMTPNLRPHTRQFLGDWWAFVTSSPQLVQKRDALIETQESFTKGPKARIRQNKCDDVSEGKWIGLRALDYRMKQVKTILQDVYTGMAAA